MRCTPIPETAPTHAQCPLKICLATICRASPELVQDSARDFSVYVLDPLESAAPASTSTPGAGSSQSENGKVGTGNQNQHGMAVGLGLMSWALLAEEEEGEEACVTGTLVIGAGVQALQVVFALREVRYYSFISILLLSALSYLTITGEDDPHAQSEPLSCAQVLGPSTCFPNLGCSPHRHPYQTKAQI